MKIDIFDFDGVVTNPTFVDSLVDSSPNKRIIVTGRAIDESGTVQTYLDNMVGRYKFLFAPIYFNPISAALRGTGTIQSRTLSASHKASVIKNFIDNGIEIANIYEDDSLQIQVISELLCSYQPAFYVLNRIQHVESDCVK